MAENEKPLPTPPKTPFGRSRAGEGTAADALLSERMAAAAAQGRLEEFLHQELPDSEHARTCRTAPSGEDHFINISHSDAYGSPDHPLMRHFVS